MSNLFRSLGAWTIGTLLGACIATPAWAQPANPLGAQTTPDPWVGVFRGGDLAVTLTKSGTLYSGSITQGGKVFPLSASTEGNTLRGMFKVEGNEFEFSATLASGTLTLSTGGATHALKRDAGPVNPLAGPGTPAAPNNPAATPGLADPTFKTYEHPSGFSFRHPPTWTVSDTEEGIKLDVPRGEAAVSLMFEAVQPGSLPAVGTPEFVTAVENALKGNLPGMSRAGEPEALRARSGPAVLLRFEGKDEDGKDGQARYVHLTSADGFVFLLTCWGDTAEVTKAAPIVRKVFVSFGGKDSPPVATPVAAPAGGEQAAAGADDAPPAPGMKRFYYAAKNLCVDHPEAWQVQQNEQGAIIVPPGQVPGWAYILTSEVVDPSVTSAGDKQVLDYLDGQMAQKGFQRSGEVEQLTGGRVAGIRLTYASPQAPEGAAAWYVAVKDGRAFAILALGYKDKLAADEANARAIFKSLRITAPKVDQATDAAARAALVGTWRLTSHSTSTGGYTGGSSSTHEETATLATDGSFRLSSHGMGSAGGVIYDTGESVTTGTWAVRAGKFIVTTKEGSASYTFTCSGGMLETREEGASGSKVWERVR